MKKCCPYLVLIATLMNCLLVSDTLARGSRGESDVEPMYRHHGRLNDCRFKVSTNVSQDLSMTGVCRKGTNIGNIHGDHTETSNVVLSVAKRYISRSHGKRSEGADYTLKFDPSGNLWHVHVEFMPRVPGGHTTVVVTSSGCVVREIPGL